MLPIQNKTPPTFLAPILETSFTLVKKTMYDTPEPTDYTALWVFLGLVQLAIVIAFFVMVSSVSKIKRLFLSQYNYQLQEQQKAYEILRNEASKDVKIEQINELKKDVLLKKSLIPFDQQYEFQETVKEHYDFLISTLKNSKEGETK